MVDMQHHSTVASFTAWRRSHHAPCAAVFTMGALHEGHAALIRRARERVGHEGLVVATVFVNPTQFGNAADLAAYPVTLEADADLLRAAGADALLAPTTDDIYGSSMGVTIDPGPLGSVLEGASRPGHFAGVLTVVAKLLHITTPDVAMFGEKDYQQLTLIRQMARDLNFPVDIEGVETVRDTDGLALSSRNARLSPEGRQRATALPEVLHGIRSGLDSGVSVQHALDAGHARLHERGVSDVDYLVVTGPDLGGVPAAGSARALVAATVDGVRLIDNMEVTV